jgi:hypothetical protein
LGRLAAEKAAGGARDAFRHAGLAQDDADDLDRDRSEHEAAQGASERRDVVVTDYQLPEGFTAVDVAAAVTAEFREAIPTLGPSPGWAAARCCASRSSPTTCGAKSSVWARRADRSGRRVIGSRPETRA